MKGYKRLTIDKVRYKKLLRGDTVTLGRLIPGISKESVEWTLLEDTDEGLICQGRYAGALVSEVCFVEEES